MFSNPWRVIIEKAFVCFYIIIGIEKLERAPNKKRVPNQCLLSRLKFKGLRVSNSNIDLKRLKQAKTESQKTAFVSCSNKLINIKASLECFLSISSCLSSMLVPCLCLS